MKSKIFYNELIIHFRIFATVRSFIPVFYLSEA